MLEDEMSYYCMEYFRHQNFKWVKEEIPFLSRCIDALYLNNSNELVSVEFKISKWRHAILQASYHRLGADKAYICLPRKRETKLMEEALTEAGIGLMLYNIDTHEVKIVQEPSHKSTVALFRERLINTAVSLC